MKKVIYCLVALSLLLSGCSDNLSKGDAAEMIKTYIEKQKNFPMYADFFWLTGFGTGSYKSPYYLPFAQIEQLNNDGYIKGETMNSRGIVWFEIRNFTEKAKPFITISDDKYTIYLQIATVDKVVVNRIVCGKEEEDSYGKAHRNCEAEYEIKYKPTAPGEKLHIKLTGTGTAQFNLNDKVWTTYAHIPPQNFPIIDSKSTNEPSPGSAHQQPQSPNPLESKMLSPSESKPAETQTKAAQPLSISPTTRVSSPSFDCAKASSGSEHLICSNANLAAVDVEMVQIYKKLRKNTFDTKTLKREQNQWRKAHRDACKDVGCMLSAYAERIKQLNEQLTE